MTTGEINEAFGSEKITGELFEDVEAPEPRPDYRLEHYGEITEEVAAPPARNDLSLETHLKKQESTARTRIGYGLVCLLLLIVLTGCIGWLAKDATTEDMQALAITQVPIVTLVATILGYYFHSEKKN